MATPLNIVAQRTMDLYLTNYRVTTDFYDLDDFIAWCAYAASDIYNQLYREQYAEIRANGGGEVVSFSDDFLSEQIVEVKPDSKNNEYYADLKEPIMSFTYDNSAVGCQSVWVIEPAPTYEIERSDIDQFWQMKYAAPSDTIYWAIDGQKLRLKKMGECNARKLRVLFVPSIQGDNGDVKLPDGIVNMVMTKTVANVRQLTTNVISKETLDGNSNKAFETEGNLKQTKP